MNIEALLNLTGPAIASRVMGKSVRMYMVKCQCGGGMKGNPWNPFDTDHFCCCTSWSLVPFDYRSVQIPSCPKTTTAFPTRPACTSNNNNHNIHIQFPKQTEEMREFFHITNDFTPEEEAEAKDSFKWCEASE